MNRAITQIGATFGSKIKDWRVARLMKQQELADYLGVSRTTVTYWENGQRNPPETMLRLALRYYDTLNKKEQI